jgi:hypothetical protein
MHLTNTKENDMTEFNATLETWVGSGKFNNANAELGYVVSLNDDGTHFLASVKKGVKTNGNFTTFGYNGSHNSFDSQEQATEWAYKKAKQLIKRL